MMKKLKPILFACLISAIFFLGLGGSAAESAGTIFYVDQSATAGTSNGESWENAFISLQDALDIAQAGDQILVAEGVYKPSNRSESGVAKTETFTLIEGVEIYGGFPSGGGGFSERDWELYRTILSGDLDGNDSDSGGIVLSYADTVGENAFNVVTGDPTVTYTVATVLDGFVVTAGQTENSTSGDNSEGAGLRFESNASPTLRNLWIVGNNNTRNDGGGIHFLHNNSPVLENVTVENNNAGDHGGGIFFENNNSPVLKNVTLIGNTADKTASLYFHEGNEVILANISLCGNKNVNGGSAKIGAGLSIESDNILTVMNGAFGANINAGTGGAFRLNANNTINLHHVSMGGNQASNGGAIYFVGSGNDVNLFNSVLWGNGSEIENVGSNSLDVQFSIVGDGSPPFAGNGNQTEARQPFVEMPVNSNNCGNLNLNQSSAAVNTGSNGLIPNDFSDLDGDDDTDEDVPFDLAGNLRIFGAITDMGALEISAAPLAQTITFDLPADVDSGMSKDEEYEPAASASSGLDVSYSTSTPTVCTIANGVVTMIGGGVCTISADQYGDGDYSAAETVSKDILVNDPAKTDQTIVFLSPADGSSVEIGETVSLSVTATSGLEVEINTKTPEVCTTSPNQATMLTLGSCELEAIQIGDEIFNPAPKLKNIFSVTKKSQAISFDLPQSETVVDTTFDLSANSTSGLDVVFDSDTPAVCTVLDNQAVMLIGGECELRAMQDGDEVYAAALDVTQVISVTKLPQSIDFSSPENNGILKVGERVELIASASSGLEIDFLATPSANCVISENKLLLLAFGVCQVTASQAGDDRYRNADPVTHQITIESGTRLEQSINFQSPEEDADFDVGVTHPLSADASSGLAVTFSSLTPEVCVVAGSQLLTSGNGKCQLEAFQAGDSFYASAPKVVRTIFVKKNQMINFPAPPAATAAEIGDVVELSASADSGLPVQFNTISPLVCQVESNFVYISTGGECRVEAVQAGSDGWYAANPVTVSFDVSFKVYLPLIKR